MARDPCPDPLTLTVMALAKLCYIPWTELYFGDCHMKVLIIPVSIIASMDLKARADITQYPVASTAACHWDQHLTGLCSS